MDAPGDQKDAKTGPSRTSRRSVEARNDVGIHHPEVRARQRSQSVHSDRKAAKEGAKVERGRESKARLREGNAGDRMKLKDAWGRVEPPTRETGLEPPKDVFSRNRSVYPMDRGHESSDRQTSASRAQVVFVQRGIEVRRRIRDLLGALRGDLEAVDLQ
jgi:hypothetical protein